MSIGGFVTRSRERISVLRQQIEAKRIEGGGTVTLRETQKERAEIAALETAIYKATRRGIDA